MQTDSKFPACCFWALAGSRSGSQSTYDTVSAKGTGRPVLADCTASGGITAGVPVSDVRPGEVALTAEELRDLIDELTRKEWRLLRGLSMRQMAARSGLKPSGVRK